MRDKTQNREEQSVHVLVAEKLYVGRVCRMVSLLTTLHAQALHFRE